MMTSLINVKRDKCIDDENFLYIGRANKWLGFEESKWHNPFPMKNEGQRKSVLIDYLDYILAPEQNQLTVDLHELDGKLLGCYCAPKMCHGDILIRLRVYQKMNKIGNWPNIYDWIKECP